MLTAINLKLPMSNKSVTMNIYIDNLGYVKATNQNGFAFEV